MLVIQDKLISLDLIEKDFVCNLKKCKGACCWEGDFGAPLEATEIETLEKIWPQIKPYLDAERVALVESKGFAVLYKHNEQDTFMGTPLMEDDSCAYMSYDDLGIAQCGIEQAYKNQEVSFRKPISCHLYPVRVKTNESKNFEALNYDKWDICSAACSLGEKLEVPVYSFVKDALIRKYGPSFYAELEAAANHLRSD